MKIVSWNVNGIRAVLKKDFLKWVKNADADIICLQEIKAHPEQLDQQLDEIGHYHDYWCSADRPGYAGTAIFSKKKPLSVSTRFHKIDELCEGRIIEMHFEKFILFNIYFPNGGTRADGTEMLSYKLGFYDRLTKHLVNLVRKKAIIVTGDYNIAHTEIDLARPKENAKSIGFLPEERAKMDILLSKGFTDVFRHTYPDAVDEYTWWSYRAGARARNVGWRLDYFWVSEDILGKVKNISHQVDQMGSDHCPVVLEIKI